MFEIRYLHYCRIILDLMKVRIQDKLFMKNRFLFYITKRYSIPIIEPIVKYLQDKGEDFGFYFSDSVFQHIPEEWKKEKTFKNLTDMINFNPVFVIVPGNFVDFRIPGIKAQIFHGLGVEKKSHYKIRHYFDVYFTSGPFVTEKFKELQKKYKYFLVEETGWSKIDYILKYPTKKIRKEFKIPNNNKRIILYAPTFSPKMQSAKDILPIIPKIIKDDEIWFVKFHDLMNKKIVENFKENISSNIRLIDSFDITPYLHLAEILISDTSSVIYEFLVLDKPIITFKTQSRFDKGIDISHPDELRAAIDRSLQNPEEFRENRMKHIQEINPYLDGSIGENIIEKLIKLKEHDAFPKIKKPLNLFRKWKLSHRLRY